MYARGVAAAKALRSWRGLSLFVVGEQIGEEGKTLAPLLPPPPPGCGL